MEHPFVFISGLLGNIISFLVYLAPLPTFYRIYKKKSTEGFHSVPYVVALFSAMLWIYYACLKTDAYLLITINTMGLVIEIFYILMFFIYAPNKMKISTAKMVVLLDVGVFGIILVLTYFLSTGSKRVLVLGWICAAFSVSVFAAPLSIMRHVIRTKSAEYLPFLLSVFHTLSAVMWFSYGFLIRDFFIALPNILGFIFGLIQMILYVIYKDGEKNKMASGQDLKLPEQLGDDVKMATVNVSEMHPVDGLQLKHIYLDKNENPDQRIYINEEKPTNKNHLRNMGYQARVEGNGCPV